MSYKAILALALPLQSAALASENVKLLNKKKKSSKDFIETGIKNIIGVALIKEQAGFIGSLK